MDLLRHISVLWKHRLALAAGILVGAVLAVLVGYNVQPGKSPLIKPRGHEDWMSVSRLLVTQEGFPEGRVTLPKLDKRDERPSVGGLQFADPARFQGLASLYAVLANSDQVRSRMKPRPDVEQITALVVDPDGPGSLSSLPVIELSTVGGSAAAARKLNIATVAALRSVLVEQQNDNKIPAESRVRLDSLDFPSSPTLVTGRSHMASLLVFMIALLSAVGFALLMESLGGVRGMKARSERDARYNAQDLESAYAQSPSHWERPERPAPPRDEVAAISKLPRD